MNTNFFRQIAKMDINSQLILNIGKATENQIIVSVFIQNDRCGDKAKNIIPPFILKGTAEELDNGFFERIKTPLQTASELIDNMETFMKQLEEAKAQSAMEKVKTEKAKKEQEAKDKKFKQAMDKVDELEKEGKFREAWIKVPDIAEYPEKADELRKRKTSLSDKFATPNLFGAEEETAPEPPQVAEATADCPTDTTDEVENEY